MHTRIPESLDQQLKSKAEGLGMSVSNLVRNVLLNTFDLVEDIVSDSANIARLGKGHARPASQPLPSAQSLPPPAPEAAVILGWQELILNLNALCQRCNGILPKGTTAYLGITNIPSVAPHFMCSQCIKELNHDTSHGDAE
ncbi:MAG TPA: hypothetical protein VFM46_08390 [Pseudomonadales bacterium]|nr:hypothetical protein [Pseudomonadales bacterium]